MNKKITSPLISLAIIVVFAGGIYFWHSMGSKSSQQAPQAPPAPSVNTITVNPVAVIKYSEMPGRTLAFEEAEVRPEVTGIIRERVFQEGAYVEEGDTLYLIDSELYEASYDSAKASLARAEAAMNVARVKEQRTAVLRRQNSISQQDYDETRAVYLQAKAEVAAATAAVTTAKINLDRTVIRAPISGLISKSTVSVGTLIANNQPTPLTTIYNINPMNVDLMQSVQELVDIRNDLENSGDMSVDFTRADNLNIPVVLLTGGEEYKHLGNLSFVDVGVNADTATMTLRATFPNSEYLLMPGLFVRAKVQVGIEKNALLIPQRAVLRDTKGNPYVFVADTSGVNTDNASPETPVPAKAMRRAVTLGATYGTNWLVTEGLKPNEQIIVKGLQNVNGDVPINILEVHPVEVPKDAPYLYSNSPQAKTEQEKNQASEPQVQATEEKAEIDNTKKVEDALEGEE